LISTLYLQYLVLEFADGLEKSMKLTLSDMYEPWLIAIEPRLAACVFYLFSVSVT
jgi:hypothetical protein